MANIAQLLTEHMAIWTSADTEKKSGRGRASGNAGSVYGVKKLRELILELAVRGKLVPQDANDEPASELLKRIQAEKAKLIAEGKLKKEKSLAPIGEDEKPFELPNDWEWARVVSLAEIKGGKRLPEGKTFSPAATPYIYIQVTNMKNGTIIEENLKYIDEETRESIKNYTISSQDLYITIAGTIGDVGTVPTNFDGMILTENAAKIIFRELDKLWFKYCFKSSFLREQFQEKTIQLAQPKLALHRVASSVIALPPLAEQHRIVAKVDELMALCDQLEQQHSNAQGAHETLVSQLLATLTQSQNAEKFNANWQRIYAHFDVLFTTEASIDVLKQTLLQLAVMGKLVPQNAKDEPASELLKRIQAGKAKLVVEGKIKKDKPLAAIADDEKPFELPDGWVLVRLDDIGNTFIGLTYSPKDISNVGTPVLRSANVQNGKIDLNDLVRVTKGIKDNLFVENGDLLICVRNGSKALVGKTAMIKDLSEPMVFGAFMSIYKSPLNEYVEIFLNSPLFRKFLDGVETTTINQITQNNLKTTLLPLPPFSEQNRIVTKVDALMTLCDQLKTRIQQANQQQQTIANALVAHAVA